MNDNHIGLLIVCVGVGMAIWFGGSILAIMVAMAMTACGLAGLYGATGYKAHRFFIISLLLSAATIALERIAL